MEMAKDSAKRYSRIEEFSDVKIFDESGKEIQFMARGGEPKPSLIPDYSKISGVVVEGIDTNDAPDFVDAYIADADYDGEPMTDEQLEELNYDGDFVYSAVERHLYAKGGNVKERVYIDYLNKAKGFKNDRKYFDSYEEAVIWARKNFDKFDSDYIKYEYADGGMMDAIQFDRKRNGSLYDRGNSDSYYGRAREPHWYPNGTYNGEKVTELTKKEIEEYNKGYDENTDYKDYGEMARGGKVKSRWIQDALSGDKGALRKTAKRKGLIKGDEKLSKSDLRKLEKMGGKTAKRARLAETLIEFKK
jgi:hypothetical protein